jgi:hypothetical protein
MTLKTQSEPEPTFVFDPNVDKVLAFFSGLLLSVVGVLLTAVSAYSWAGGADDICVRSERRAHAAFVTLLSAVGAAIPIAFAVFVLGFTFNLGFWPSALISPT